MSTTIFLVHPNDCSTVLEEYHFPSEEAAHAYMRMEGLDQRYMLERDFEKMMEAI